MQPYIGEVRMFGGNFAPRGWAFCSGQLLAISQNNALFSILGTTYGGDGRTSFGLPELRGRVCLGQGNGPGLSDRPLGQKSGLESVNLNSLQIPAHSHIVKNDLKYEIGVSSGGAASNEPTDNILADSGATNIYSAPNQADEKMGGVINTGSATLYPTGGSQGHNNVQPVSTVHFIIALVGLYPSRS